ncbi:MAG: adenylyltransferase/cytidyltransferase family protein [Verrucomicrobiae bacterium]|nr:adenylyltransferase/cytidyltransferase family protein [Verrucomicrobiae bacterium]MDW7978944.1 adenylyltransferase/cytidyltransferase family protein [Verrucomicrobiales bacterium]
MQRDVIVTGDFDDLRSRHVRFLHEASRHGPVTLLLWPDALVLGRTGAAPKFPEPERLYLLRALRFVSSVVPIPTGLCAGSGPDFWSAILSFAGQLGLKNAQWAVMEPEDSAEKSAAARAHGYDYRVVRNSELRGFPDIEAAAEPVASGKKKVIVTGCFDWLHSGHVRFFEEVSALGDLYVAVGNDANVRMLKGPGHPLHPQEERRYMVASVRFVKQALITTGSGWLDAEPEILRLKPDIYAVNEDGDRGGKREFCQAHGIQYVVLKREPAPGLPRRSSTELRGF